MGLIKRGSMQRHPLGKNDTVRITCLRQTGCYIIVLFSMLLLLFEEGKRCDTSKSFKVAIEMALIGKSAL